MAKLDIRKTLRAIATSIQDDNLDRFLRGITINGGQVASRVVPTLLGGGRAKRVRLFGGVRVSLRDLAAKVGVKTGAMLKDITRKANQKIGRAGFKIIPSPEQRMKWFAFQAGTKHQVARPTSGVSDDQLAKAGAEIARDGRDQFVRAIQRRSTA